MIILDVLKRIFLLGFEMIYNNFYAKLKQVSVAGIISQSVSQTTYQGEGHKMMESSKCVS